MSEKEIRKKKNLIQERNAGGEESERERKQKLWSKRNSSIEIDRVISMKDTRKRDK